MTKRKCPKPNPVEIFNLVHNYRQVTIDYKAERLRIVNRLVNLVGKSKAALSLGMDRKTLYNLFYNDTPKKKKIESKGNKDSTKNP